jgi:hypothetical protein
MHLLTHQTNHSSNNLITVSDSSTFRRPFTHPCIQFWFLSVQIFIYSTLYEHGVVLASSPAAASRTNLTQIRFELVHFHFLFRARKNRDYGEWRKYKHIARLRRLSSKIAVSKPLSAWLLIKVCQVEWKHFGVFKDPGTKRWNITGVPHNKRQS